MKIYDPDHARANRAYYLSRGLCPRCGGANRIVEGRVMCAECQIKHDTEQIERRERWKAEGRCVRCGGEPADGKAQCQACLDKRNQYQTDAQSSKRWREKNKMMGLCVTCGKTWAEPGRTKCRKCQDKHNAICRNERNRQRAKERRQARIDAGLCIDCGRPTQDGKHRCPRCIEMRRDSTRKWQILQRMKREAEKAKGARV
mgnify:CR=1 FL=1